MSLNDDVAKCDDEARARPGGFARWSHMRGRDWGLEPEAIDTDMEREMEREREEMKRRGEGEGLGGGQVLLDWEEFGFLLFW